MTTSPSIKGIARWLAELLPTIDLQDGFLQWQAQLLGNYSGHMFVPHSVGMSMPTLWQAVLAFSLAQLSIRQSLPICAHRTNCLKANSNIWRVKLRGQKCGVDSKRGTFNNLNCLHPTPTTTVLPCCQDNPLLYSYRCAFHIIHLPLRRLPYPLCPLLPLHPLPLAQDSIAHLVAMAAHLPHPLITKMVDVKHVFSRGRLVLPHIYGCLAVQSMCASLCVGLWSSQGFVKQVDLRAALDTREVEEEDELPMDWDAICAV